MPCDRVSFFRRSIHFFSVEIMAEFSQVDPQTVAGLTVTGVLAQGPYVMRSKIWLPKQKLTRRALGDLFYLDSETVLLKGRETGVVVAPEHGDEFPIEQLDPKIEWECDGEPKRRFGILLNTYSTVKTATAGVLGFSLFIIHVGLLLSMLVTNKQDSVPTGLWQFTIAITCVCVVLELVLGLLLFLVGSVDVDRNDGQEASVAMCHCVNRGLYKKTLRYWNNATTFAACCLSLVSLVSTIAYVVFIVQSDIQQV